MNDFIRALNKGELADAGRFHTHHVGNGSLLRAFNQIVLRTALRRDLQGELVHKRYADCDMVYVNCKLLVTVMPPRGGVIYYEEH